MITAAPAIPDSRFQDAHQALASHTRAHHTAANGWYPSPLTQAQNVLTVLSSPGFTNADRGLLLAHHPNVFTFRCANPGILEALLNIITDEDISRPLPSDTDPEDLDTTLAFLTEWLTTMHEAVIVRSIRFSVPEHIASNRLHIAFLRNQYTPAWVLGAYLDTLERPFAMLASAPIRDLVRRIATHRNLTDDDACRLVPILAIMIAAQRDFGNQPSPSLRAATDALLNRLRSQPAARSHLMLSCAA